MHVLKNDIHEPELLMFSPDCQSLLATEHSLVFFFSSRRRHTRSLCDWSSDVCSSDLPVRPRGVDNGLPTKGTGRHEWTGFVDGEDLPQQIGGPEDTLINWNNKPAKQFAAADDEWSYGSRQRVLMLREGIAERRRHTLASVTSAMNAAATTDFR